LNSIQPYIRLIPDFPKPGIQFWDITPLVKNPSALAIAVDALIEPFTDCDVNLVAGMEARGFIFGALAASRLGVGFVPLRKPGKLPYDVQSTSYDLEYGSASLEVHIDAMETGDRVLLVDDLIATGGTAAASCELIKGLGAEIVGCTFVVELDALGGREKLHGQTVNSLVHL
jgi:adenine phosphoribosyltransferase